MTAGEGRLTVMLPDESAFQEVLGLTLRSIDDQHSVVHVTGPELHLVTETLAKVREALAKVKPRWLGAAWPNLAPTHGFGMKRWPEGNFARAVEFAEVGIEAGATPGGTTIRVRAGTSIEDAANGLLQGKVWPTDDGMKPVAILRINRQRALELEVGLEPEAVMRAVRDLQLPSGVTVSVH